MALYARMSFNNNGWNTPSGKEGKSPNSGNHEHDFGFGFEEWFFNKRRFKSKNGGKVKHHFAYLEPLSEFDPLFQNEEDLVLYTLKWDEDRSRTNRYIVLRLKKEDWRFIGSEEYLELKKNNNASILAMRRELAATMPVLSAGLVINRFNQQKEGNDYNGNSSEQHRLWNIEILKEIKVAPDLQEITKKSSLPDRNILKRNYFKLYEL